MQTQKIIGIALIVIGGAMLLFSNYIADRVVSGKAKVQDAQSKVDAVDSLFSISKYSQPIGKQITDPAQKKINEGHADIQKYDAMSYQLKIGGILFILVGVTVFVFAKRRRAH